MKLILIILISCIILLIWENKNNHPWQVRSVDTVKFSRDLLLTDESSIDKQIKAIADTGANYVAIGTPYDEKFVPVLTAWVKSARKQHLNVWFRGNFSGWEGWFNFKKITPEEHQILLKDFLTKHKDLFVAGDIFTSCPECENGGPGDPRKTGKIQEFRDFLVKEKDLSNQQLSNVKTGYFSMNGDVAKLIMDETTTKKLDGVVVIDHYTKTPEELINDVDAIAESSGGKVILGEIGVPILDINGAMTDTQQADWLKTALGLLIKDKNVLGLNYWTNIDSSTALWNPDGTSREAVSVIRNYYKP